MKQDLTSSTKNSFLDKFYVVRDLRVQWKMGMLELMQSKVDTPSMYGILSEPPCLYLPPLSEIPASPRDEQKPVLSL